MITAPAVIHASNHYSPYLSPSYVQFQTPLLLQKAELSASQAYEDLRVDPEEMASQTI
jgi:hypothetical protein